jgi:cobalt-zinc-cadmium efflux system outer membrane protein
MGSVPLVGTLPERIEPIDWQQLADSLVIRSPEYQAAQARVARARANINRQTAQPIPNLRMQLGTGFDNSTDAGMINLQVGAPIPVNNKNQGNISGARAEYCRAVAESERIAAAIHERVGSIAKSYDSASVALTKYVEAILPAASETLDLAEAAYEAGESNFLQLLVTRQTFFETRLEFLAAREEAAKARARVDGFTLTGALQPVRDDSGDSSLRGDTFSQE